MKKIDEAREHIHIAYKALEECTYGTTWGYSDMEDKYIDKVFECLKMLLELKRKL